VTGMTCIEVTSVEQVSALMDLAERHRSVCATDDMSATSSRSHSVFVMYLRGTNETLGSELSGALHMVDLASSELDTFGPTGEGLAETRKINNGLASLANVLTAKAEGCADVPFRTSNLTHLMEPCVNGHGKTVMLVNVDPQQSASHKTLCSLRFARQVALCNRSDKLRRSANQLGAVKSTKPQTLQKSMAGGRSPARRTMNTSPPPRAARITSPPRRPRIRAASPPRLRADTGSGMRWKN